MVIFYAVFGMLFVLATGLAAYFWRAARRQACIGTGISAYFFLFVLLMPLIPQDAGIRAFAYIACCVLLMLLYVALGRCPEASEMAEEWRRKH